MSDLATRLGGPWGRRAGALRGASPLWAAGAVATLAWVVAFGRVWGCLPGRGGSTAASWAGLCYTDLASVAHDPAGQPPLTLVLREGIVALWPHAAGEAMVLTVAALGLVALVVTVGVVTAAARGTRVDGSPTPPAWTPPFLLALAPSLVMAGAISTTALPLGLAALGLWCVARRRTVAAGLLLGLAATGSWWCALAALAPVLALARAGRWRDLQSLLGGALVTGGLVNAAALALAPSWWRVHLEQGLLRGPGDSLGSLWGVADALRLPVPMQPAWHVWAVLVVALAVAAWALLAPRRPRVGQIAFVLVAAELVVTPLYQPQSGLVLVALLALARPRWRTWAVLAVGETINTVAVFAQLSGALRSGSDDPSLVHPAAVVLRVLCHLWCVAAVVRDSLHPVRDVVRHPVSGREPLTAVDDPLGGPADAAPDAAWVTGLRARLGRRARRLAPATGWRLVRTVTLWWLASRVVLLTTVFVTGAVTHRPFRDLVSTWDVQHFQLIATWGYAGSDPQERAFFPGVPALLRLGQLLVPDAGTELRDTVSLAFVMALAALASWAAALALARLGGPLAAILWLFAPMAIFTLVPYTEAFFVAFAFWAWERARRGSWAVAALLAAGACCFRVSGLFLIGALGVLALTSGGPAVGALRRLGRAAWLLVPAAVLGGYATYLWTLSGSWTEWFSAQNRGWHRQPAWPWQNWATTWDYASPDGAFAGQPDWTIMFQGELIALVVGVAAVVACLRRRLWGEASWVGVQLLAFSISSYLFSVPRAILLWFPVWVLLAAWWRGSERAEPGGRLARGAVLAVWLSASVLLGVGWTIRYVTFVWAG